jgi:cleavage stimulation factor subunit 3
MADDEAEKAFFQAQAMNADTVSFDGGVEEHGTDQSDSEDYDPSKALQDQLSASIEESKQSDSPQDPSISQSREDSSLPPDADQIEDTYPSQTPSRTESRASASAPSSAVHVQPKTKTMGGFVVEDDEEDEEDDKDEAEYEPPAVLGGVEDVGPVSASLSERPISENANETVSTSDVSVQPPAPDVASSKDVSNNSSSHPTSVISQNGGSPAPGQNMYNVQAHHSRDFTDSPAPTPTVAVASAARGRLPHDRVGILEDRIKEDPRGDIPAWLELISEHRSRNRIDSAREVYERFFKVFPWAVCHSTVLQHSAKERLTDFESRLSSGWHMWIWNLKIANFTVLSRSSIGLS